MRASFRMLDPASPSGLREGTRSQASAPRNPQPAGDATAGLSERTQPTSKAESASVSLQCSCRWPTTHRRETTCQQLRNRDGSSIPYSSEHYPMSPPGRICARGDKGWPFPRRSAPAARSHLDERRDVGHRGVAGGGRGQGTHPGAVDFDGDRALEQVN